VANVPPQPVVVLGLRLRRLLHAAGDAMLPGWAIAWQRSMGIAQTEVMAAMAELGVADALGRGRATAAELAPRIDADPDTLHRVLRGAALYDLLRLDRRGRFRLTRVGRALRADDETSLAPWSRYLGLRSTREAWGALPATTRSGAPSFSAVHGSTVWEWFAEHPEEEQLFASAMRALTEFEAPTLVASDLWPEAGTVCDVAGGAGTLLAALLGEKPGLRGILVEAPGVLAEARSHLERRGLSERVELVEGDLLGTIDARADVYVMKNILHDWHGEACGRMLATVAGAMPSGARLLVIEQLQEPDDPHPFVTVTDLQMLTQCEGGRERSPAELQALLTGAGLRPGRVDRTGVSALVEGTKP
jgi:O-methyltransferase domain